MKARLISAWNTLKRSHWVMTFAMILLVMIGVFFIYSATFVSADVDNRPLHWRQLLWALLGFVGYLTFSLYDYRQLRKYDWSLYGLALGLLVAVLLVGTTVYGAKRWLMIFGDGGFGLQPSEFAKFATIVLLASRLSEEGRDMFKLHETLKALLLLVLPVGLILMQPDLGTAIVFIPTVLVLMYAAGVPFRYVGSLCGMGAAMVGLIVAALFLPEALGASEGTQERIARLTQLSDYQRGRIEVFFQPDKDPLGAGWNKRQSEIAVGSGGFHGKGYLQGTQNILGFLPRTVAPTDFIYSVIAEEKGFVGATAVLVLFGVIIVVGIRTAIKTLDPMGRALCTGITALFFFHCFVNVAMTIGMMPITGLPLPLLSYGGSFMVVMMSGLGIVQSVYIRSDRRVSYR